MFNLLSQLGLPFLITLVSKALGSIDNPLTRAAAEALNAVDEAIKRGQITTDQMIEANRHTEEMAIIAATRETSKLAEINASLRAEVASNDPYVRRMRPTFGYIMALTWAAQMFGAAYIIVFETEKSGMVLNAISSLSAIWTVGLSVLGIYVYKRSREKLASQETIFWNNTKK